MIGMDKFHRNKTAIRIKVISMGNAETGKVLRITFDFLLTLNYVITVLWESHYTGLQTFNSFNFVSVLYIHVSCVRLVLINTVHWLQL